jgi:hypothetical protein
MVTVNRPPRVRESLTDCSVLLIAVTGMTEIRRQAAITIIRKWNDLSFMRDLITHRVFLIDISRIQIKSMQHRVWYRRREWYPD